MPKLTKTAMRYRRTDPNYRKALLLKREGYDIHMRLVNMKILLKRKNTKFVENFGKRNNYHFPRKSGHWETFSEKQGISC